jgi:hypothetical protein
LIYPPELLQTNGQIAEGQANRRKARPCGHPTKKVNIAAVGESSGCRTKFVLKTIRYVEGVCGANFCHMKHCSAALLREKGRMNPHNWPDASRPLHHKLLEQVHWANGRMIRLRAK